MDWILKLMRQVRALFQKRRLNREIDEEIRFHLELTTQANVKCGMSPHEAHAAALRQFGWVESIKQACREQRGAYLIDALLQDARFAARMLLKNTGFTLVAVLTLALGIGANTAVFSIVYGVLFRPLPYKDPSQIMVLFERNLPLGMEAANVSPANFLDWKEQSTVFEEMAFVAEYGGSRSFILTGQDQALRLRGRFVSSGLFPLLGLQPILGRFFVPQEDRAGSDPVVILSHGCWTRNFGGNTNIVGQKITLDNFTRHAYTVIGVMGRGLEFPIGCDILVSAGGMFHPMNRRVGEILNVYARLKPGMTREQAQMELSIIQRRISEQFPKARIGTEASVVSLQEKLVGQVRTALFVFLGAVAFVLLIACANVSNLLLARASVREKEIAIRAALGASRWRVVAQLLIESVLLSLLGTGAGIVLAFVALKALLTAGGTGIPRLQQIGIDGWALGFTFLLSMITAVLFGLAPALQSSRPQLNQALRDGGRGSATGLTRNRFRNALVVIETALALVLLIGAGLMLRSFARLQGVDPGFNPKNLLVMDIDMAGSVYANDQARRAFFQQLLERLKIYPDVKSASGISMFHIQSSGWSPAFYREGHPPDSPSEETRAGLRVITPDYFRTMGIRLLKGRIFAESDSSSAPSVIMINQSFARRYFSNGDPIGQRIVVEGVREIVGVVADANNAGLNAAVAPEMYGPYTQFWFPSAYLVVRTVSDPLSFASAVRNEVKALNKDQPTAWTFTAEQYIAGSIAQPRFRSLLLGCFGGLALLLGSVGIYGVMSYSVAQRTHEMGLRMALGARRHDVLQLVIGQGMRLTLAGISLGLIGSFALTRVIATQLYGLTATDPTTFVSISLLLLLVTFLACVVPAWRATKVDPMVALRFE